jgi:hypothetical protein
MADQARRGAVLLLLLLGAVCLEVANAKSRKVREDALNAGKPKKARRGAAGQLQKGPRAGRDKSAVFAECFNSMQDRMLGETRS